MNHDPGAHPESEGPGAPALDRLGRGARSHVTGHASACPLCGAREKVSLYVLDSIDDRYSHRCSRCGEPSPLREWNTPPMAAGSTRGG
jgi:hypothetical protein